MKITSDAFIPVEELRKVTEGSFEQQISRLEQALSEEKVFGEEPFKIVGTYPTHVVALSESGTCLRLRYEAAANGKLLVTGKEPVEISVYNPSTMESFLHKEALKVVESFLYGQTEAAKERLRGIAPFVGHQAALTDDQVVEALLVGLEGDRPWRTFFRGRTEEINKVISEADTVDLAKGRLESKFIKLYDASMEESELEGFRSLVLADLSYMKDRVRSLADLVSQATDAATIVQEGMVEEADRAVLTTFGAFGEDLLDNLRGLARIVGDAPSHLKRVDHLGRLYDVVVESVNEMEIAGRFVTRMAERLSAATKE